MAMKRNPDVEKQLRASEISSNAEAKISGMIIFNCRRCEFQMSFQFPETNEDMTKTIIGYAKAAVKTHIEARETSKELGLGTRLCVDPFIVVHEIAAFKEVKVENT